MLEVSSRDAAEDEKRELIQQEKNLIDDLANSDGGLATKLQSWAQIVEELINHAHEDYSFAISHISTYIRRECHRRQFKFTHHVDRYLSDKYKNPNMARIYHIEDKLEDTFCHPNGDKPIEQYSLIEMEFERELLKKTKDVMDKEQMRINNKIEEIDREAINRGLNEIGGEKIRDSITCKDYRYEIPNYFGLKELNEEVVNQGNRMIKALDKFFNEKYSDCPATVRQDAWKYANAVRVMANLYETVNEDKWSGEKEHWFDREFWKEVQSTHDAGNSTMFPTSLCAQCSANIDEDPKDFHRMKYWRPSPTGYICDNCGGTKVLERENTREQVGDKEPNVLRDAADLLNHAIDYPDVYMDWRNRYKNPEIYARKAAISEEFRIASMGKEKLVISRKNKGAKP